MSNQLRTPHRFILDDEEQPFTPCTRLSNMTIESQTNGHSRFRKTPLHGSPINLIAKFAEVAASGGSGGSSAPHPNLDMCLGSDRISIFDRSKVRLTLFETLALKRKIFSFVYLYILY